MMLEDTYYGLLCLIGCSLRSWRAARHQKAWKKSYWNLGNSGNAVLEEHLNVVLRFCVRCPVPLCACARFVDLSDMVFFLLGLLETFTKLLKYFMILQVTEVFCAQLHMALPHL